MERILLTFFHWVENLWVVLGLAAFVLIPVGLIYITFQVVCDEFRSSPEREPVIYMDYTIPDRPQPCVRVDGRTFCERRAAATAFVKIRG